MSRQQPSLNALRVFEAAARHLSFSRAAEELGVTQGAVSRQIKTLEDHLGMKLFRRLTRALELTEAGSEYLPAMREAFDRMEQATQGLMRRRYRDVLTVSVLPTFAIRWLIPRLGSFTDTNPSIEVRMITSILPVNFAREDIDVAIRVGRLDEQDSEQHGPRIELSMTEDWTGVHADLVTPDVLIPVCSAALRDGDPPLREPADLARHTLLHITTRPNAWPDWLRAVGLAPFDREDEPAFGHFFMSLQAATEGRGVAVVPEILVASDLVAGNLVKPFDVSVESDGAYYLLCRQHQRDNANIAAFRQWLLDEIAAFAAA